MEQLILHLVGDYITQTDPMATYKKKSGSLGLQYCIVHCVFYSLPFFLIGSWKAVLVIFLTHFIIDRSNFISRFLAWRNGINHTDNFGFPRDKPFALAVWLNIITDNAFHLICNYLALKYL